MPLFLQPLYALEDDREGNNLASPPYFCKVSLDDTRGTGEV